MINVTAEGLYLAEKSLIYSSVSSPSKAASVCFTRHLYRYFLSMDKVILSMDKVILPMDKVILSMDGIFILVSKGLI